MERMPDYKKSLTAIICLGMLGQNSCITHLIDSLCRPEGALHLVIRTQRMVPKVSDTGKSWTVRRGNKWEAEVLLEDT